jgi:L-amino acid N-acyltransferase YncA
LSLIQPSRDEDVVAFTAFYGHHVLTGTGTFEIAPTEADRASRQARLGAHIFGGHRRFCRCGLDVVIKKAFGCR